MKSTPVLESRHVEVSGRPMHYIASTTDVDPRPPVVLIHGVGLSHRYLLPVAELLARDFRVLIPDLPGFGLSFKPDRVWSLAETVDWLARWIERLGLQRPALLGNSVGCQYIVDLAVRYPNLVSRAVLQGPTCDPAARTLSQQIVRWTLNRNREHLSQVSAVPVRFPEEGDPPPVRDIVPANRQDYRDCGWWRLYKTFLAAMHDPIEQKLPEMHCPTLVVAGSRDPIVPLIWAEEVVRRLPQGRLIELPGVPHTANLEAPLELYRVSKPFLLEARHPPQVPMPREPQRHAISNR